jgi:signal transduction histidine kinase
LFPDHQYRPYRLMIDPTPQASPLPIVWIVDDSPLEAELVRRSLASVYCVEVFTDGASVLEQIAGTTPPDAIILDWQMPGISGLEICGFLRSRPATIAIPVLILTVHRETADLVRCLAAGADDFLSKPYNPAELSARVAALVRTKRMHARLESAERAVRALLMQLPEAVISIDAAGRVTFANIEAQRMLSATSAALVGRPLRELLPSFFPDRESPIDGVAQPLEDVIVGDRVYAPAVRRYAGVDATDMTLSFRDVTAERSHERERARLLASEREARAEAEEASRAKDMFLATVSHELRTPLNAILGWTRLVREGLFDDAKRDRALDSVERNALAQQKLIEDILDVSRIISGKLRLKSSEVDVAESIRAATDSVRPALDSKSLRLELRIDPALPKVCGDEDRLQQIIWNLLSNAVKFTPRGGSIVVSAHAVDEWITVSVTDTGEGILSEFIPHIFERFRQADNSTTRVHGGLGLGLSIVRHIVESHGGTIRAESAGRGQGATFTVRLPLAPGIGPERATSPSMLPSGASLRGVRVLLVDDDVDSRELVAELLQQRSAEVVAAGSVSDAIDRIRDSRPHVIISDIGMPKEDGYSLATRLRTMGEAGSDIPAIALTAYVGAKDGERALAAGFDAHLGKPVDPVELVDMVARLSSGLSPRP